jgi:hypothetical protein
MTVRDELERVIRDKHKAGAAFDVWEFIDIRGPALLEALRDAERYRWLRDNSVAQYDHPIVVSQRRRDDHMIYIGPIGGLDLDHAIDQARHE